MVRQTLKILHQMHQDFWKVPDHFEKLCIKGLKIKNKSRIMLITWYNNNDTIFDKKSYSVNRKAYKLLHVHDDGMNF